MRKLVDHPESSNNNEGAGQSRRNNYFLQYKDEISILGTRTFPKSHPTYL